MSKQNGTDRLSAPNTQAAAAADPHADVKAQLRAHLDRNMLSPRELDADLGLLLEGKARRRSLMAHVALPGVLAVAALALFAVMRAPEAPPLAPLDADRDDDAVLIYIADSDDPTSAIVIDFAMQPTAEKHP